jgi:NAD(P)-dependent dehydrogenase (short-subunit alcohol dehydrogenase family)
MNSLAGKTALITGAGRGIGAAVAEALSALGANLVLAARGIDAIAALAGQLPNALAVPTDVADAAAVERLFAAARARFGRVDILVNNAATVEPIGRIADADPQLWAASLQANIAGQFFCARIALADLPDVVIVNVSSGAAARPQEGWSAYCAGKAALAMLTQSLHLEYGALGLRTYGFRPGVVDTEMQVLIRASGINPISRLPRESLQPATVPAQAIAWLCGADAADLAGQEVDIRDPAFRARIGVQPLP